jgi:hypothetical protein
LIQGDSSLTALILLIVLGAWAAILFSIGYFATFWIWRQWRWVRVLIGLVVMVSCYLLPVIDEIQGKKEFEALCKTGGTYQISPKAVGKKFDLIFKATENILLPGYSIPIEETTITYTDAATGEVVASVKAYIAKKGWFARLINYPESGPIWVRNQCFPADAEEARRQQITNKVLN